MGVFDEQLVQGRSGTRLGRYAQNRMMKFVCGGSTRLALENTLINSAAAGIGPPFIPRCTRVDWVEEVYPDVAFLTAHFQSVPWPGEAYVTVHFATYSERKIEDRNGQTVEGPSFVEGGKRYRWRRIAGDAAVHGVRLICVLHTAFSATNWGGYYAGANCVNSNNMVNLAAKIGIAGSGAPGRWLLHPQTEKPILPPMAGQDDIVLHDYAFEYEPRGWNNLTRSLLYRKIREQTTDDDEEHAAWSTDYTPVGNRQARVDYAEFNFAGLDNSIVNL